MLQNLMTICWSKKVRKLRFDNRLVNYRLLIKNIAALFFAKEFNYFSCKRALFLGFLTIP